MERRERTQKPDMTRLLLIVIAALAAILVTVIVIAVVVQNGQKPPVGTEDPSSSVPSSSVNIGLKLEPIAEEEKITMEDHILICGTSDPAYPLTVNGSAIARNEDGSFQYRAALSLGKNEIVITHKDDTETLTVERRYVVQKFSPAGDQTYGSGATVLFEVFARKGSRVTAEFNGTTVQLELAGNQLGSGAQEGFVRYVGSYKLTAINTSDLQLGVVTYTATCDAITETYTSGNIVCQESNQILASDPNATPSTGGYINVGSGYIAEVITYTAETFDGTTTDDYSRPTNNYLPTGTLDYCPTTLAGSGKLKYVVLRSGQRVYLEKKDNVTGEKTTVMDRYIGKLPDHNEIGFASMTDTGKHLVLALDCLWKAPFYFDLEPQRYAYPNGGGDRSYAVTSCTAEYVEIRFCYATEFTGTVQLPQNNPLFSSAEVIDNGPDHTLRLYLKKKGAFYGWDAYYNGQDQLCFQFLKPAVITSADNAYGADLTGVTVMLDVGHGGKDGGAVLKDENGKDMKDAHGQWVDEAAQNLKLAMKLKAELESMGATVIMNRTNDSLVCVDERLQLLKAEKPDLCVCIHHNAIGGYPNINGLITYYYTPFSQAAANEIYKANEGSAVYQKNSLDWLVYYTSRQTACPVVLMENGYVTSPYDVSHMLNDESVQIKAEAAAQGVANYFLSIQ